MTYSVISISIHSICVSDLASFRFTNETITIIWNGFRSKHSFRWCLVLALAVWVTHQPILHACSFLSIFLRTQSWSYEVVRHRCVRTQKWSVWSRNWSNGPIDWAFNWLVWASPYAIGVAWELIEQSNHHHQYGRFVPYFTKENCRQPSIMLNSPTPFPYSKSNRFI
jgi:hypothetical protein